MLRAEGAKSTLRVAMSIAIADTILDGFDNCTELGCELSGVQKRAILSNAFMAYHEGVYDGCSLLEAEAKIMQAAGYKLVREKGDKSSHVS